MNDTIVGIGEILWDVLPEGKKLGGAPANFAYHLSQFGLNSCAVSAVGKDELGTEILNTLQAKGIQHQIEETPYPTGTVQVSLDDKGIPCYDIKQGVAWDNLPCSEALLRLARQTRAVCFGSLAQRNAASRQTIQRFLDHIPDKNQPLKIFDINLRQNFYTCETLSDSLTRCNILKINDEELEIIRQMYRIPYPHPTDQCRYLLDKYQLKLLILTCGTKGSYALTPGQTSFRDTPHVNVADTVGAGDSFTAAFVAGLLSDLPLEDAHSLAVDTSAYVCTQHGAMPTLPQEITARIQ